MTSRLHTLIANCGAAAALFLALDAAAARAQADPWHRLVAEADSVGPDTPHFAPSRWLECGAGVERADSVQVSGGPEGFLFARRSMRTRGYFDYQDLPPAGAARFAVRSVLCHEEGGHPYTFVLERDHRYFYMVFSLRKKPTYEALAFRSGAGDWRPFLWDPARRTFAASKTKRPGGAGRP
jgi:hypothetical protein